MKSVIFMLDGYGPSNIYIKPNSFLDINPVDCGWERCAPGHYFGPAIRDYYLIHYVSSGCGTFKNQRAEYTVRAGQLFIIRPCEITYYRASDHDPWNYSWIGFKGNAAKILDTAPDIISADCKRFFDAMKGSVEYDSMREEVITAQIYLMIAELFGNKGTGRNHSSGFASRAANYIDCRYMSPLSVEDLAVRMNIDRRYLSRLFKQEYGMTIQEYIVSTRMKHARAFLREGYSVGQAASMTGYSDVFNFSKMFKKHFGISPSEVKQDGKCTVRKASKQ